MKALPIILLLAGIAGDLAALTHPPLREVPAPSERALGGGPHFFVDPLAGDDSQPGNEEEPWRTIGHAMAQLEAGDTLLLRGGSYHENVYCAAAGTEEKPITIRSYPGEQATIDGSLREFQENPASCWEPLAKGEFRSVKAYRNIRDVLGAFADSNIGLQTYWHHADLVAENELWIQDKETGTMAPVYCGPGIWYDKQSGRIHCRLAHTHVDNPEVANYSGETDPRKVPMVIAPFASKPLEVDQAQHVRFQDLVIRGGGHDTVELNFGIDVTFENCTIFCGTYGIRARATGPLRLVECGIHGGVPPWAFRNENSLHTNSSHHYDPFIPEVEHKRRNIARLNTHALLVTEGSYEFEVFYFPRNHDWEIERCHFSDAHDGVYLSGHGVRFHNNLVENIQDDAIYLSSPAHYTSDDIHIYQNHIRQALMAFGCHSRGGPGGDIFIYRNIADLRKGVNLGRPTPDNKAGRVGSYHIFLVHGRRFLGIESMYFYQNTFVSPASPDAFAHRLLTKTHPATKRRVFNNIFVYLNRYGFMRPWKEVDNDLQVDANLHWCVDPDVKAPVDFLSRVSTSKFAKANAERYPAQWCTSSLVADPKFQSFAANPETRNDYRLRDLSPALEAGISLPEEWSDPSRPKSDERPDLGALPSGAKMFPAGRTKN